MTESLLSGGITVCTHCGGALRERRRGVPGIVVGCLSCEWEVLMPLKHKVSPKSKGLVEYPWRKLDGTGTKCEVGGTLNEAPQSTRQ